MRQPDAEWERLGREEPYYAVLNEPRFRTGRIEAPAREEFFRSGEEHVAFLLDTIRRRFDPGFAPGRALDFGCGVGRCTIPLARAARSVIGLDVSQGMLAEAERNCAERGAANVELLRADDGLSRVSGRFDLIHSVLVFQHIPPRRGLRILARLLDRLAPDGVAAVQVAYHRQVPAALRGLGWLRKRVPLANELANVAFRRPPREPLMEKNVYDLNRVLVILRAHGCEGVHVLLHGRPSLAKAFLLARRHAASVPQDGLAAG